MVSPEYKLRVIRDEIEILEKRQAEGEEPPKGAELLYETRDKLIAEVKERNRERRD